MFEKQLKSPLRSPLMRAILAGSGVSTPSYYLNLSSPSNVTIADGQANGTITSTYNAVITASMSPSRTTGVAPLYVNFDMTGTTSTDSTNPTHECFFATDFGDSGAGTWANGVQSAGLTSKNAGYGPVTGHVYETPGTYTVTMSVTDGVNTATKTGTIVVQDPDVVYAGTDTICLSHSGNFTGKPTGALEVDTSGNTDMYADWIGIAVRTGKRILFCKAVSWTCSASMLMAGLNGTTVGGYGTGAARSVKFGTTSDTLVSVTPNIDAVTLFECGGATDCRVSNFKINAMATHVGMTVSSADTVALTYCKIEVYGATSGFSTSTGGSHATFTGHDQHCLYECLNDQTYGYAGVNPPTFTGASGAVGTPGVFTANGHTFNRFNKVRLTGTPPAPLATGVDYFISGTNLTANTFSLSSTFTTDTPLAISGVGTCDVAALSPGGGQGIFVALTRGGIMGCYMDNCNHGEQALRIPYVNTGHINNNYVARPNQGKNAVKIHCRGYDDIYPETNGYSEKLVFSANFVNLRDGYSYNEVIPNNGSTTTHVGDSAILFGAGGPSPGLEHVRNGIFENNFTQGRLGNPRDGDNYITVGCSNVTVRNNIADFSLGDRISAVTSPYPFYNLHFAIVNSSTEEQTVGVRIYNNTLYSNINNAETAEFVLVTNPGAYPNVDSLNIRNNLWYLPQRHFATPFPASEVVLKLAGTAAPTNVTSNAYNTDTVAGGLAPTSPGFAAHPPVVLSDWRPSGYPVNTGATVPVLRDFNNASRVGGTYDLGAVLP